MRDAILTLYHDDPICPQQQHPPSSRPEPAPELEPAFLTKEAARLTQLEREIGLRPGYVLPLIPTS